MDARTWMDRTTEVLLGAVDGLTPDEWNAGTALPDWRPREIVAHVHHNAEALIRLASWARTGVEARMYPSMEQRDADIVETAAQSPAEIAALVHGSARDLAAALDALEPEQWERPVNTAQGRTVPASEIPWMRAREAGVHAVDLGTALGFDAFPEAFVAALVEDVVGLRLRRGEGPTLAAWLTGRGVAGDQLGPWI